MPSGAFEQCCVGFMEGALGTLVRCFGRGLLLGGLAVHHLVLGVALRRHGVRNGRQDRVGFVELRGEDLDFLLGKGAARGIALLDRRVPLVHGLGHLDREEQRQEVADPKTAAPRLDGFSASVRVALLRAHPLNKLKERRLVPGNSLEHVACEDLVKNVAVLNVDKDFVLHNLEVLLFGKMVADELVQVAVPTPHDNGGNGGAVLGKLVGKSTIEPRGSRLGGNLESCSRSNDPSLVHHRSTLEVGKDRGSQLG
mmetsp:Transcript_7329/g.18779  ORF Transcript_7329/g.18779 Transcript_7329/m.18779 type:complete len:254 (+) Transcript_7329:118-879(+)